MPTVADNRNFDYIRTRSYRHTLDNFAKAVHRVRVLLHNILGFKGSKMILQTLSFLVLFFISGSLGKLCPAREEVYPCTCDDLFDDVHLSCNALDSIEELKRPLSAVKGKRDVGITLHMCDFGQIPSDLFSGLDVVNLELTGCNVDTYGDDGNYAFAGLAMSLRTLSFTASLKNNKIVNLSNLKSLVQLHINGNRNLTTLPDEWFPEKQSKLRTLYLDYNGLHTLGDNVFSKLTNLKFIWLAKNSLTTLKRSMFPPVAQKLEYLVFSDNQIEDLPPDLFNSMTALDHVELDNNNIRSLPKETWSKIFPQLHGLSIINNPLNCDYNIDWISDTDGPSELYGHCSHPPEREGMALSSLIREQ